MAPKPKLLSEEETLGSFKGWKNAVLYLLRQKPEYQQFLKKDAKWKKSDPKDPSRGFVDDGDNKKENQVANLEDMLTLICQYVPSYLATSIEKNTTSLDDVWSIVRKYCNLTQSESQFMKFAEIKLEQNERPEKLYQRLIAHMQDNLMSPTSPLKFEGEKVKEEEVMCPTMERWLVLHWMQLIHPGLPAMVTRTFAYDLQRLSLKDLQPQICDAIPGFLVELENDEVKASRAFVQQQSKSYKKSAQKSSYGGKKQQNQNTQAPKKTCRICKAEGRRYIGHNLPECDFVTNAEKRGLTAIRLSSVNPEEDEMCDQMQGLGFEDDSDDE